jgi:hypothetical protein
MSDSKIPGTTVGVDPEDTKKEKKSLWERLFNVDVLLSPNIWLFVLVLCVILVLVMSYFQFFYSESEHELEMLFTGLVLRQSHFH